MESKVCRLQSKKKPDGSVKYVVWFPPKINDHIKYLKLVYGKVLGREVSSSIILRRSLELLRMVMEDKVKAGNTERLAVEAARLASLIR